MKPLSLLSTGSVCFALFACSTAAEPPPSGTAGASSVGGSTTGAGGAPTTDAGATSVGGATVGGSPSSTAGSGGASGGEAPVAGAAGTITTGGASAGGAAGTTSAGGSTAMGGAGGGTAGAAPTVDTTLAGSWDGALLQFACGNTGSSYDCQQPPAANCKSYNSTTPVSTIPPSNGAPSSWTMGGDPNTTYAVTVRIRGVVEVNYYPGGKRLGAASVITTPRNLFQEGGAVQTNGGPSFDYNTYQLDVTPPVAGLPNQAAGRASDVYYLNSVTQEQNPHYSSSVTTIHKSYDIDYTATIKVKGGGKIVMKVTDSNCTQVQNCGESTSTCAEHRTVALTGAMPAAPAFAQPLNNNGKYGQWVFFDVTDVAVAP